MPHHTDIAIRDESIRLGQLLKLAGLVDDGGLARLVIANGEVRVDGEVETRRGAQIRVGQVVQYADQTVRITAQ
ncbi:RNA-binding S4 domain-containing protein [Pseudactinotalea terrae]|uniref:RNA-binding S4 domain-containing protein n=1 Tax=Pseudactinotalea terrae TaxID=1743262 RepID=UPI0012E1A985|nr:RNA-binding S4 domain-containing protein [Pseudactinotalea terrae]